MAAHAASSTPTEPAGKRAAGLARAPRFHVDATLSQGARVFLDRARAHQLAHVLRARPGEKVRLFNAADGEWLGSLVRLSRQGAEVVLEARLRDPAVEPGARLAVAPIRANRLDWLVEKAVELGVAEIALVPTRRSVVRPERIDRLRAIAIEAAEQCGRLSVPALALHADLPAFLAALPAPTTLVVADEAGGEPVLPALAALSDPVLLVGPEGGFAPEERELFLARPGTRRVSLGPRVLRSETAALFLLVAAALARPLA
ncbi:MAG: RsmE family RNA methyltransferase [Geminicoccaceae bacterium]|nr:RsmE family RNA methyltransferase [Geminicoccaceae bacterium]